MELQPLNQYRQHVVFGTPLPFGVLDAGGRLLLARGRVIENTDQLEALLERGAFVDRHSVDDPCRQIADAAAADLPRLWDEKLDHVARLMRATPHGDFTSSLDHAARPLAALVDRDPDLAIFQILCHDATADNQHAERRTAHASIATRLTARCLGWQDGATETAFRASLTMNIALVELMNKLSRQVTPPTRLQREQIQSHPDRGAEVLEAAGVDDADWLAAVRHHHAFDDVDGYPRGLSSVCEIALLLQRCDRYTAKLSPRGNRAAMAPDVAARQLFQSDRGNPMTAALIKTFGLYPPGTPVRLVSGEMGIVVRRGDSATTPTVAVLVNRQGEPLVTPLCRHTAKAEHAIAGAVSGAALKLRVSPGQLGAWLAVH